jgi:hypothetical protein
VELVGTCSGVLSIYLSATPDDATSPLSAIDDLVTSCCADAPSSRRDQLQSFIRTTLSVALHYSHGALVAVLPQGGNPRDVTSDGVILKLPISLCEKVEEYEAKRSDLSLAALTAYRNLFIGMLSSDGIVIIDSQCRLIGYNLFIKAEDPEESASPGNGPEGGARHRAYRRLKQLVDKAVIKSCFIQSSDGSSEFYKR